MLSELFLQQKEQLDFFFQQVDIQRAESILEEVLSCRGKVVFSGIGKSGIIADKIAKTMASTGTRALSLSAVDALHGDIGMIEASDLLVVLSKSGHTKEIEELIRIVKQREIRVMGWFCNEKATLAPLCDFVMQLPIEKELCPFDLAPTTSTSVQLLFGDILAVALMKKREFSLNAYALNHPAGTIGKRATFRVENVMLKREQLPIVKPDEKLSDVLVILTNKRCGCLLIVDERGHFLGIFTDGDLRRAMQKDGKQALDMPIEALMTSKCKTIQKTALVTEAIQIMQSDPEHRVMMLPVIYEKRLIGLITMHDVAFAGII
ncbi:MAG: KpsF/GutQ family sugar-phosphate isomerase [Simkaniaceae bacterium]|nr:KpsF/GutQ family sugar-phosphate isomerase [Simkaniaceae bacterium]